LATYQRKSPFKPYKSKAWLRRRFVIENKSIPDIAKECNVSEMTIRRQLEEFELIRKS
jgi:transposase